MIRNGLILGLPNLLIYLDDEIEDGYNIISTRIKWGDEVDVESFTQKWGSDFLHFRDVNSSVQNYIDNSSMRLELDWYGLGKIYFDYSLSGSSKAIKDARVVCGAL